MEHICEFPKYSELSDEYGLAFKEFERRKKLLKKEIFGPLDIKRRIIEEHFEEEFLRIWNDELFTKGYVLSKFRFDFGMHKGGEHHYLLIMGLETSSEKFDLESIALKYPTEKRKHEILMQIDKKYLQEVKGMESELDDLGFSNYDPPGRLKDFIHYHGILIPSARYFELPQADSAR